MHIDAACERYQNWEGNRKEEYLIFTSNQYRRNCGVKLDDLLRVGCNKQYCYQTTVVDTVTSFQVLNNPIETKTAFLSVSPFRLPYNVEYKTRFEPIEAPFSGLSGQFVNIFFDPKNPWKANNVCQANCMAITPVSSQWFQLSSNVNLAHTVFDFVHNPELSSLAPSISAFVAYPLSAVPLSGMGSALSSVPVTFYDLSAFYPPDELIGPPVEGCVNIGAGYGIITPNCDSSLVFPCSGLDKQYGISPSWNYVLTSQMISSVTVETSSVDFASISSFFVNYCDACNCNCAALSTYNESLSTYYFEVNSPVLSGDDGRIIPLSSLNISSATHVKLNDIPACTDDGSIPLVSNNGITETFVLCNSAFSTSGPMPMESIQFFKDAKPPVEAIDYYCGINNNGFTMSYYNSSYDNCIRTTPTKTKVDVTFYNQQIVTNVGTVSTVHVNNFDEGFGKTRKVLGVFSVDTSLGGYNGMDGNNLLFNFDYALMASTFGYDLQGGRGMLAQHGYDLTTYHLAKSFVDQAQKMLRYTSYTFDPNSQYLKVIPEPGFNTGYADPLYGDDGRCGPYANHGQCYLIGVYLSPTVEEMLGTYWVQEYVLAKAKTVLGSIRGMFGSVQLYGGATIDGKELVAEGNERIKELMDELRKDNYYTPPPMWFIG